MSTRPARLMAHCLSHIPRRFLLLTFVAWLVASTQIHCAELPDSTGGAGLAVDTNDTTTRPSYVYVEPKVLSQQNIDLGRGTTGGHTVMATDGNNSVFLVNEEDTSSHPRGQIFYRSDDGGLTWNQKGTITLATNQCSSALAVLPKSYGAGTQRRLVYVETVCSPGAVPGNANSTCAVLTYVSDDGASSWTQAGNATGSFTTDYCSGALGIDDVGVLHYVYSSNGANSPNAILHNQSSDGGQSWGSNSKIATVASTPRWPSIAATRAKGKHQLTVAYELTQPNLAGRWSMGGVVSNDNGATWSTPKEILAPDSNHMVAAPNLVAMDANTVAATFIYTTGDHNQQISEGGAIAFGATQVSAQPVMGAPISLSANKSSFPLTILAMSNTILLVSMRIDSSGGPILQRITLKR